MATKVVDYQGRMLANKYFSDVLSKLNDLKSVIEQTEEVTNYERCTCMHSCTTPIDFILVYNLRSALVAKAQVNNFLMALAQQGFLIEGHYSRVLPNLLFIKLSCPRSKLIKAGIVLDMNLACLSEETPSFDYSMFFNFDCLFNDLTRPTEQSDVSQRAREAAFNLKARDLSSAERILVVYELLRNVRYGDKDDEYGILSLLHKNYLMTCFPLHETAWKWTTTGALNDRQILMEYWAKTDNLWKIQPHHVICKYFGTQVAFYFAFMGFWKHMLLAPAFAGLLVLLYGVINHKTFRNYITLEICVSNYTMCPRCPEIDLCPFQQIRSFCQIADAHYIFDNMSTAMYTILWCFWATFVLCRWRRRETVLRYHWDLSEMDDEINVRPEYVRRAMNSQKMRRTKESKLSRSRNVPIEELETIEHVCMKVFRRVASTLLILIAVLVILIAVGFEIFLRISLGRLLKTMEIQFSFGWDAFLICSAGNLFALIFILISEPICIYLAHWVTDFENPRTQEEYNYSVVYKVSLLSCLISYSFLFYTAFIKGIVPSNPLNWHLLSKLALFLSYDSPMLLPQSITVGFQWTFIVIGKHVAYYIRMKYLPWTWKRIQKLYRYCWPSRAPKEHKWEKFEEEYLLRSSRHTSITAKYLRVTLDYGYLVLFSGAQPLGPLILFILTAFNIRHEAYMILVKMRRNVPTVSYGLGPWLNVLKTMTILGIGTNTFYIVYATCFVNMFTRATSPYYPGSYIQQVMSRALVVDFSAAMGTAIRDGREGGECLFSGSVVNPEEPNRYQHSIHYWSSRTFDYEAIIIIELLIIVICGIIVYLVGSTSNAIKEKLNHRRVLKQRKKEEAMRRERLRRSSMGGRSFHAEHAANM